MFVFEAIMFYDIVIMWWIQNGEGEMIELTLVRDLRNNVLSAISSQVAVNSQGVWQAVYEICNVNIDCICDIEV